MAGEGNRYEHPHEETLLALEGIGAAVYGSDSGGDIVVTTDGETYTVATASRMRRSALRPRSHVSLVKGQTKNALTDTGMTADFPCPGWGAWVAEKE